VVRYRKEGAPGLRERSRRPHGCAHQTALRIEQLILRERRKHRTWGPKKLRRLLRRDHGIRRPSACSTIAGILHRSGLSQRPRRKPGLYEVSRHALTVPTHPNHVWTVDFKGWFTLGNGYASLAPAARRQLHNRAVERARRSPLPHQSRCLLNPLIPFIAVIF